MWGNWVLFRSFDLLQQFNNSKMSGFRVLQWTSFVSAAHALKRLKIEQMTSAVTSFEMEIDQPTRDLPEELVEKIICSLPFPSIFKARTLSKSWLSRFSFLASQDEFSLAYLDDQIMKFRAASFQKQVGELSSSWDSFYDVRLGLKESRAYNLSSHTWQDIPSLSFLPEALEATDMLGPLVLLQGELAGHDCLCVANILTGSWKVLPPRPVGAETFVGDSHILRPASCPTYKVVAFCGDYADGILVQIYDSKKDVWTSEKLVLKSVPWDPLSRTEIRFVVYLDGILYTVANHKRPIAINVEDGTWEEIEMRVDPKLVAHCIVDLVVCSAGLLAVLTEDPSFRGEKERYQIVKVDWGKRSFTEVCRGPPPFLAPPPINPGLDTLADCIFVSALEEYGPGVLAYDLRKGEWSLYPSAICHPYTSYTRNGAWNKLEFQPGLNPFAMV